MKPGIVICTAIMCSSLALSGEILVRKVHGDVSVRHGVAESWTVVSVGDVLRPDDTMKTGKKGSVVLSANVTEGASNRVTPRVITLPAEVIVDMSDIRELSQEELMLKLTMEKVRASSYQWKNDDLKIPNTTVVHGPDRAPAIPLSENDLEIGKLQLNGTQVLFDNGFYSTCALKTLEVFRLYPPLGEQFNSRFIVARSLEMAELRSEALQEYVALSKWGGLTSEQRETVDARIRQLRR